MNTRIADLRVGQLVTLLVVIGVLVAGFLALRHASRQGNHTARVAACDNSAPLNDSYNVWKTLCYQGKVNP